MFVCLFVYFFFPSSFEMSIWKDAFQQGHYVTDFDCSLVFILLAYCTADITYSRPKVQLYIVHIRKLDRTMIVFLYNFAWILGLNEVIGQSKVKVKFIFLKENQLGYL